MYVYIYICIYMYIYICINMYVYIYIYRYTLSLPREARAGRPSMRLPAPPRWQGIVRNISIISGEPGHVGLLYIYIYIYICLHIWMDREIEMEIYIYIYIYTYICTRIMHALRARTGPLGPCGEKFSKGLAWQRLGHD